MHDQRTCECGCGTPAPLATFDNSRLGIVKGQPQRFASGHSQHNGPAEFVRRLPSHLPADACWPWPGPFSPDGYGTFGAVRAHRIAYERAHGPIPKGKVIRHTCDNPPCCNPAHLVDGTHADNVRDMVERGRVSRPAAKITRADADRIRVRYENGEVSQASLAREYGLSYSHVYRIVHRKRWK